MLESLKYIEARLPELVYSTEGWESVDVDYETPRVERVWRYIGELRVCLHVIHKCEESLYHSHPWPSAIKVVSGRYEMGIGGLDENYCKLEVGPGTSYEMNHPNGHHYVKPLTDIVTSIMVNGERFDKNGRRWGEPVRVKHELSELSNERKSEILMMFWPRSSGG